MSTQENTAQAKGSEAVPTRTRRSRASVGGLSLKLDAPQRPGWVRRFVNGDPLRIARMEELGYSIVSENAAEGNKRTDSLGTRITRHAGKDDQGKPYQAILMETPAELHAEGEAEREQGRQAFEESIQRNLKTDDTPEGAYIPSQRSIKHSG